MTPDLIPNYLGVPLGWPVTNANGTNFNALHMCLIPKGPHRGKVLVWGFDFFVSKTTAFVPNQAADDYYAMQPWAIVDPDPEPLGLQFENFLLPLEPVTVTQVGLGLIASVPNLLCAGHSWSPYGDLIVVGGTTFAASGATLNLVAAQLTYVFNPDLDNAPFPNTGTTSLYQGNKGRWIKGPSLDQPRWYPTATSTSQINRVKAVYLLEGEVVIVAGGSRQANPQGINATWNSYEALRITGPSTLTVSGIDKDFTAVFPNQVYTWDGPGTTSTPVVVETDWLLEYPRLHQLSNGLVFFSGYAPRGSMLNHEIPGMPTTWTPTPRQPGDTEFPYSSNWRALRHDGCSVLMPAINGVNDMTLRVGGGTASPSLVVSVDTTPTTEVSVGGSYWTATPPLPTTNGAADGGRMFANLLPLPTGALLLIGGQNYQPGSIVSMTSPLIYINGSWYEDAANVPYSRRNYHSAAVLLPDGRVIVGGGNDRDFDYEIYSPYYIDMPANQKPTDVQFQALAPPTDPETGALILNYNVSYGMMCSLGDEDARVARVALTAPGAMTHHSDMHARHVHLQTTAQSPTTFTINAPANDDLAPRGIYMLWVVTTTGAVSEAIWVVLR